MKYCREKLIDILLERVSIEERLDAEIIIQTLVARGELPHWKQTVRFLLGEPIEYTPEMHSTLCLLADAMYSDELFCSRVAHEFHLPEQQLQVLQAELQNLEPGKRL